MKHFILTISIALASAIGFGQQTILVDSPEYFQAKDNGTLHMYNLEQDLSYQIAQGTVTPSRPSNVAKSGPDCDCYIAPDATYQLALPAGDDGSSQAITIPFQFSFYGTNYNTLYINNNGNVTFGQSLSTFSSDAFPSTGATRRIIAPFWADVDTRDGNGRVVYKITPTAIFINWEQVGYYNTRGDKRNTFQLILSNGSDPSVPDGNNVAFCYQDMQWTTGAASCTGASTCNYFGVTYQCGTGAEGFCGVPATAGANKGDGVGYFLLGRFDHPGTDFDGPLGFNDGISYLDYKSFFFDISGSTNIPPISQGVSSCDTFKICAYGDTADIMLTFLSPELDQITTITYDTDGLASVEEISNISGNTANLVLRVVGSLQDAGTYNFTITGTDNYSTPASTTVTFVLIIENSANTLTPQLSYTTACDSFQVSVLNGPYDGYLWDNQTVYPTTFVSESGVFGVTVNRDNCYKRVEEYINVPKPANFNLQGNLYLCPGEDSTFLTIGDSLSIDIMNWNITGANNGAFTQWLYPGTYTIYNQDTTGYCSNDTTFTIGMAAASTIFNNAISCDNLNYQVTGSLAGTDAVWSSPHPEISFSNPSASNPIITATAPGIYTVNLTSPCINPLSAQIVYTFKPTIFENDTICGTTFQVDENTVNSFQGGTWSTMDPTSITFSNDTIANPLITTLINPYSAQVVYTDKYCPSLSDYAVILFVQSSEPTVPAIACNLGTYDLNVDSFKPGVWSIVNDPNTTWAEDTAAVFPNGVNSASPGLVVSTPGTYTVNYYDNFCDVNYNKTITFPPFIYTEIKDTNLCYGIEYPLSAWVPSTTHAFVWNNGETGSSIMVTEPGTYTVTVSNECYTYSDDAIITYYTCNIEAPNVISLSSQAGNDEWFVSADGIADFECVIVNRWGNIIYEFNDVNGKWDGRDKSGNKVPEGVYFYTIKAKIYGGEELSKQGFIQVVE